MTKPDSRNQATDPRPLIERLRGGTYGLNRIELCLEAADELERLTALLTPDMFWNADDPEQNKRSISELVDEEWGQGLIEIGDEMQILRAVGLPTIRIRIVADPSGTADDPIATYELIEEPTNTTPR